MKLRIRIICLGVLATAIACKKESEELVTPTVKEILKVSEVKINYAKIVSANYVAALNDASSLKSTIDVFVNIPNLENFKACKTAWLNARESYGTTEAFRFASGPIDDKNGPEGLLNAWPLDESYIDYVEGNSTSGIVNDTINYPTISKAVLEGLNEAGGEENISIGYHAIEFLLWGQDLTAPSEKLAGQRTYNDFVDGELLNTARRRAYLVACADLLMDHLSLLVNEWDMNGSNNYYHTFSALSDEQFLTNVLTAVGVLSKSELAGERIYVAYENQDQEDEHSCFSDNTHRDVRLNFEGISNVLNGTFGSISGISIIDLVNEKNTDLATQLRGACTTASEKIEATATPFDYAISDNSERPAVLASVNALQDLGDKIADAATVLGVSINTSIPE